MATGYSNHETAFGQWLKLRRQALDLTREELARQIGCAPVTIRKLETGERQPSKPMAARLAEYFGVTPEEQELFIAYARGVPTVLDTFSALPTAKEPWQEQDIPDQSIPLPTLLGREKEISAICETLRHSQTRLLTLVGPPGVGKTSLGLCAASVLADDFADGMYWVELAPIRTAEAVVNSLAHSLHLKEHSGQPLADAIRSFLHSKQLLLVLDNFEHVMDSASLIHEMLAFAPQLKVMVTSREPLRLPEEYQYLVSPLPIPDLTKNIPPDSLQEYPSVVLFQERARAVWQEFQITGENARAVAEICVRLDGLPLALELAAARVKLFSPDALLVRLNMHLLTGGPRVLPQRQQSLVGAIDWSYDLLDEGEKEMFARLSIFSGGWTLEAAETVCSEDLSFDILNGLASLLDKSLIKRAESNSSEPRFTMLETIRQYAAKKLDRGGEADSIHSRYSDYLATLAEAAEVALREGVDQQVWIRRLDDEQDNIRIAMSWALGKGEIETAMRMGAPLWMYYVMRTTRLEYTQWLQQALAQDQGAPLALRAKTLRACANAMAANYFSQNDQNNALKKEALALYRQLEDQEGISAMLYNLGDNALMAGDYTRARALYEESLTLNRALGDEAGAVLATQMIGSLAALEGRFEEATPMLLEALEYWNRHHNPVRLRDSLVAVGDSELWRGYPDRARHYYENALAIIGDLKDVRRLSPYSTRLGPASLLAGDYERAQQEIRDSLRLGIQMSPDDDNRLLVISLNLLWLGGATSPNQPEEAAKLLGAGMALFPADQISSVEPPLWAIVDRLVAETRNRLDTSAFEAAWAEGQMMPFEQAIAYALEEESG